MSNDGHAILREIDVAHPAAKSLLEISRAQDEEVGDGTTSVKLKNYKNNYLKKYQNEWISDRILKFHIEF